MESKTEIKRVKVKSFVLTHAEALLIRDITAGITARHMVEAIRSGENKSKFKTDREAEQAVFALLGQIRIAAL